MEEIKVKSKHLIDMFSRLKDLKVISLVKGTNQFNVSIAKGIGPAKINSRLRSQHNIVFGQPHEDGFVKIKVNPTLLRRDNQKIIDSFKEAITFSRI